MRRCLTVAIADTNESLGGLEREVYYWLYPFYTYSSYFQGSSKQKNRKWFPYVSNQWVRLLAKVADSVSETL